MITRLRVQGFKNLFDVNVRFGPFTCVAGLNAAGKSNLFDALRFLHLLSQMPIMEAVASLRDVRGRTPAPEELFTRFQDYRASEMRFTADILVAREVEDEFGVKAKASISTLRYQVAFKLGVNGILELAHEELSPVKLSEARRFLGFNHSPEFRNSVVQGRRTVNLISTEGDENPTITVHQEGHGGRQLPAPKSTLTVLGGLANSDFPTILAANREMASWRSLMLEPSAMRAPSRFRDPGEIDPRGANLPNTILRLVKNEQNKGQVYTELSNRLSQLIENVGDIEIEEDDRSESRTLKLRGRDSAFHPAHSLSDGTLRFLVLTVLDLDPQAQGVICLEEPENGIHPERIGAIVQLLRDIAVDAAVPVDLENPLRQVIVNTHSPLVVRQTPIDDLVYFEQEQVAVDRSVGSVATVYAPPGSWRLKALDPNERATPLVPGQMQGYFGTGKRSDSDQPTLFDMYESAILK